MLDNVIVITGVSRRVGLHLTKQLLQKTDYPLVVTYRTYRSEIAELEALGAHCFQVDLCEPKQYCAFVKTVKSKVNSVRLLVHNASVWANDEQVAQQPALFSQMFCLHQQVPWMLTQDLSSLLQACSEYKSDVVHLTDSSVVLGTDKYSAYLSTKAGLENLTKSFAKILAPKVKVNAIAPGLLMFHPEDSESYRQARLQRQLLPHEPGSEVIWQSLKFIMHNNYLTGTSLPVDGGVRLQKY